MTKTGRPQGRPKGYSPGLMRTITHRVGVWSWDTEKLHSRIVKTGDDDCWAWTGSSNPFGNIMGAFKNDHQQMTQANRLLYMEIHKEPIDHLSIKMKCGNKHCSNPNHFYTDRNLKYKEL
jgi:hypothetical protein